MGRLFSDSITYHSGFDNLGNELNMGKLYDYWLYDNVPLCSSAFGLGRKTPEIIHKSLCKFKSTQYFLIGYNYFQVYPTLKQCRHHIIKNVIGNIRKFMYEYEIDNLEKLKILNHSETEPYDAYFNDLSFICHKSRFKILKYDERYLTIEKAYLECQSYLKECIHNKMFKEHKHTHHFLDIHEIYTPSNLLCNIKSEIRFDKSFESFTIEHNNAILNKDSDLMDLAADIEKLKNWMKIKSSQKEYSISWNYNYIEPTQKCFDVYYKHMVYEHF